MRKQRLDGPAPERKDPAEELKDLVRRINQGSFLLSEVRGVDGREEPDHTESEPHCVTIYPRIVRKDRSRKGDSHAQESE